MENVSGEHMEMVYKLSYRTN